MMYTVTELARKENMSPGAIRRLCAEGKLRHIRIGTKILINDAVFQEFVRGTAEPPETAGRRGKIWKVK